MLCQAGSGVRSTVPCELLVLSGWNAGDWGKASRVLVLEVAAVTPSTEGSTDSFCRYSVLVLYVSYSGIGTVLYQSGNTIAQRADDRHCSSDGLTSPPNTSQIVATWYFLSPLARDGSNRRNGWTDGGAA